MLATQTDTMQEAERELSEWKMGANTNSFSMQTIETKRVSHNKASD